MIGKSQFSNIEKNETAPFWAPTPTPNPLAPVESTKIDLPNSQNFTGFTSEIQPILMFLKNIQKYKKSRSRCIVTTKINAKSKNEFTAKIQKIKKTLP